MSEAWRSFSSAPDEGAEVCAGSEVAEGAAACRTVVTDRGRFPLVLLRHGGRVHAFVNACPHQYLPLDHHSPKIVSANGARLMCSAHGATFDALSGAGTAGEDSEPGLDPVPVFEDENGVVRIGTAPR